MIADAMIQAPRRQTNTSVCRHREGLAVRRVPRFSRAFPRLSLVLPAFRPTRSDVARNALVAGSTLFTFMPLLRLCRMILTLNDFSPYCSPCRVSRCQRVPRSTSILQRLSRKRHRFLRTSAIFRHFGEKIFPVAHIVPHDFSPCSVSTAGGRSAIF